MQALRTGNARQRLAAARQIGKLGDSSLVAELRNLRTAEPDSWVRSALDQAIAQLARDAATAESGQGWISVAADEVTEDLRASAIENVTKTLIHEMRPLIRGIGIRATLEFETFEHSETSEAIDRLNDFLATLERLQAAAAVAVAEEFDLRDLALRTIKDAGYTDEQVVIFRSESVITVGDPDLLCLALRNLIANAVEASPQERKVTVTFATNDTETWIVVLDEGVGLPSSSMKIWEPGQTLKSKKEHFGWGLTIVERAVRSFKGKVTLTPREAGGTAAEIRWSHLDLS